MNALRQTRLLYPLLFGLALTLGGCGDEHDPSHASGGAPVPPMEDLAFKDPAETAVTSLDLTASAEYVPPATNGGCPLVDDPDSDGVFDVADLCPNESGPAANDGCPLAEDPDNDGVVGVADQCPTQAGPETSGGCPLPADPDNDGVVGAADLCPNETGPTPDPLLGQVQVFARVLDQGGNLLENLNSYNFSVVLDPKGAPKSISQEAISVVPTVSPDHVVALVIDSSGSMTSLIGGNTRMQVAKDAAKLFVSLMQGTDRTAVVDFDDNAQITQQLTAAQADLDTAIDALEAAGATNLGAAMTEAVRAVGARPGKRAAILLTDGDDTVDPVAGGPDVWLNDSTSTRLQGLNLLRRSAMVVYTVGLGADLSPTGLADLQLIAQETGGEFFQALTAADLLDAFGSIIPAQIEALDPVRTYLLTFPNAVPLQSAGGPVTVPMFMNVVYENGLAVHRAEFGTSYTVK